MQIQEQIESDTCTLSLEQGRRVGQPGHETALKFLRGRLNEIGLEAFKGTSFDLDYEGSYPRGGATTAFTNLVGRIPGRNDIIP